MPKKNKVPKEEAPRDVSEDQPPVDAPPTGRTRPPHPLDQPPVEPPEDDLREMERYPTVDEMHSKLTLILEWVIIPHQNRLTRPSTQSASTPTSRCCSSDSKTSWPWLRYVFPGSLHPFF